MRYDRAADKELYDRLDDAGKRRFKRWAIGGLALFAGLVVLECALITYAVVKNIEVSWIDLIAGTIAVSLVLRVVMSKLSRVLHECQTTTPADGNPDELTRA